MSAALVVVGAVMAAAAAWGGLRALDRRRERRMIARRLADVYLEAWWV